SAWAWKSRAKHRRNKARSVKAMRNACAKWCLRGKMLRKMDRIAIPCDLGKADHIRGVDDLFKGLGHSDREIFEIKHLERQHFRVPRVIAAADRLGRCSHGHGSQATPYLNPLDAIRVMLLIRLAISI